jgi:16S rRNA (cytosine967-C5)-methyltransferase
VERTASYASELLHSRLTEGLKEEDRRLVHELVFGVLRWQGQLDFLLEKFAAKSLAGLDWEVRLALRLGLYQIRFLQRVPKSAAVDQSVELVKFARKRSAASLVNAVLRKASRGDGGASRPTLTEEALEASLPRDLSTVDRLAILQSHPRWLIERWLATFGRDRTERLLLSNNEHAPMSCRLVTSGGSRDEILAQLAADNIEWEESCWLKDAIVLRGGSLQKSESWRRGWLAVQDEASQMIALLLVPRAGDRVLDLCCAPGGKTAQIAAMLDPASRRAGSGLLGSDRHLHRLRRTRSLLRQLGVGGVPLVALDGTRPLPFGQQFDRVLVDAPCSGTGTLARHPEIRWRLKPQNLTDLHGRQVTLLRNALASLAPHGRLVYATCSLEREENEQVVEEVLTEVTDCRLLPAAESAPALALHLRRPERAEFFFDATGYFRTFPPEDRTDGFFAAILEWRQTK